MMILIFVFIKVLLKILLNWYICRHISHKRTQKRCSWYTNSVGLSLSQFKNLATLKERMTTSSYPTRLIRRIENLPSSLPLSLFQRREHTPLLITKESKCPRGKLHRFMSSFFIGTADGGEKMVKETGLAAHFGIIPREGEISSD